MKTTNWSRTMAKSKSPFIGSWHIVSMSAWEDEALNEEGQLFIEFDEEGMGKCQFGNVQGLTDHFRSKKRDEKRLAQFSWDGEGVDRMPLEGIGWVILEGGEMSGTISIHLGDDLQFVAKRAKQ